MCASAHEKSIGNRCLFSVVSVSSTPPCPARTACSDTLRDTAHQVCSGHKVFSHLQSSRVDSRLVTGISATSSRVDCRRQILQGQARAQFESGQPTTVPAVIDGPVRPSKHQKAQESAASRSCLSMAGSRAAISSGPRALGPTIRRRSNNALF